MSAAVQEPGSDFHRTDDMGLVAFLKYRGHTPQSVQWQHDTCYWYFRASDSMLNDLDDYTEDHAVVEPKQYNRFFLNTKREFYDANPNDHGKKRQRAS